MKLVLASRLGGRAWTTFHSTRIGSQKFFVEHEHVTAVYAGIVKGV